MQAFPLACLSVLSCSSDDNSDATNDSGTRGTGGNAGTGGGINSGGSGGSGTGGSENDSGESPDAGTGGTPNDAAAPTTAAAVYVMSNASSGNDVLGFLRGADGMLTPMAAPFATGGKGSGMGLGEQGAVAYDRVQIGLTSSMRATTAFRSLRSS